MSKGTIRYKGKYFVVYQSGNKFKVYSKSGNLYSSHNTLAVAKAKAKVYNTKASKLSWWDRD